MAANIPTLKGRARQGGSYTTQSTILSDDWATLAETAHFLFRQAGARAVGWVEDLSTTSTTFQNIISVGNTQFQLRPHRPFEDGLYKFQLQFFGADVEVKLTLGDTNGNAIVSNTTTQESSTLQWDRVSVAWDPSSNSIIADLAHFGAEYRAASSGDTAKLKHAQVDELLRGSNPSTSPSQSLIIPEISTIKV